MKEIGVRELKKNASAIVRSVREERARYTVTLRGRPVGVLGPIEGGSSGGKAGDAAWAAWERAGAAIRRNWRSRKTGAQLVAEQRR